MAAASFNVNEGDQETQKAYQIISTLPKEKSWWFELDLLQYQGFWLPREPGLKGLLLMQDHFISKPRDIILATSPKCGSTWLRALLFSIVNRTSYDFSKHPLLVSSPLELVPFLEGGIYFQNESFISHVDNISSPRLFSTHIPYTLFPKSVTTSGCRFVYICRNPKDVLVSKWHFANKLRSKELPPLSLQDAYEFFSNGISNNGPYWDHVLNYLKASLEAPDKVFFMKYEDMKTEPSDYIKRLAEFLGMPFSTEEQSKGVVEEIIKLCSFDNLSGLEVNKKGKISRFLVKNSYFFRKGEVGDWKNYLTPEMATRLDQITKEKFHEFGLTFDVSP